MGFCKNHSLEGHITRMLRWKPEPRLTLSTVGNVFAIGCTILSSIAFAFEFLALRDLKQTIVPIKRDIAEMKKEMKEDRATFLKALSDQAAAQAAQAAAQAKRTDDLYVAQAAQAAAQAAQAAAQAKRTDDLYMELIASRKRVDN